MLPTSPPRTCLCNERFAWPLCCALRVLSQLQKLIELTLSGPSIFSEDLLYLASAAKSPSVDSDAGTSPVDEVAGGLAEGMKPERTVQLATLSVRHTPSTSTSHK